MVFISFIDYDQAFNKALEDIKTHWDTLAELPVVIEDDIYSLDNKEEYFRNEVKTLLDFEEWIDSLLKVAFTASQLPIDLTVKPNGNHLYPECLLTCKHELAVEFRYLLPDTPSVRAILPVLMVGYIVKRRGERSDCYDQPISRPLCSLLTHDKSRITHFKRKIDNQFRLSKAESTFSKLKYEQLKSLSLLEQKLSPLGIAVLFLFLAYKTKKLCNLPLSFALFEEFTGCLSLFDDALMVWLGDSTDVEDKALHADIAAYLISIFGTGLEPISSIAIDSFIMNFIAVLINREIDSYLEVTNEWAYTNIYIPYKQHCVSDSGIRWIFDPDKSRYPGLFNSLHPGTQAFLEEDKIYSSKQLNTPRQKRKELSSKRHPIRHRT